MQHNTGLYFHVRKFPASYEEEELLTNLNRKHSKQSRVNEAWEELIQTNAIQMKLSKLRFQYTPLVPNW
jgi:hypothetical protein